MLFQIDNDLSSYKAEEINHEEIDYFLKIFTSTQLMLKQIQKNI